MKQRVIFANTTSRQKKSLDWSPKKDTGKRYFDNHKEMLVAHGICLACEAKYLIWYEYPAYDYRQKRPIQFDCDTGEPVIRDLSYRSTFDDEPGEDDLPKYVVEKEWVRKGSWSRSK